MFSPRAKLLEGGCRFFFRYGNGVADAAAGIVGERFAEGAEDHIVDLQDAIGGEPLSTAVTRICREAAVRSSWRKYIHPRRPVGPSSQSCDPSDLPPVVKSGIGGLSAAFSGERKPPNRKAMNKVCFMMVVDD